MRGKIDKSKVVPGAWATAKAQQAERLDRDPRARAAWERRMARDAERGVRADAKMYAREHGKRLAPDRLGGFCDMVMHILDIYGKYEELALRRAAGIREKLGL